MALTNWTQWLSLHVDWTFFSQWPFPEEAGSGEKKKETKKEGRKGGGKKGRKDGRKCRSQQAFFSKASWEGEKGRQEPDGHLCTCGAGGVTAPGVPEQPRRLPTRPSPFPPLLLTLLLLLL